MAQGSSKSGRRSGSAGQRSSSNRSGSGGRSASSRSGSSSNGANDRATARVTPTTSTPTTLRRRFAYWSSLWESCSTD